MELVPDAHRNKVSTLLVAFDSGSVALTCFLILKIDSDVDHILKGMFWMGIIANLIFFLVVPESPRYLFMNQ